MDCGDLQRLGFSQKLFIESKQTACIDHHVSNEAFADVNYIVPDASSTSELVYNLLDYDKMSLETAEALYMGIAHDTGIFRYSCTSPETMEAAAQLMRKGSILQRSRIGHIMKRRMCRIRFLEGHFWKALWCWINGALFQWCV